MAEGVLNPLADGYGQFAKAKRGTGACRFGPETVLKS
jgi:hypothetical protein